MNTHQASHHDVVVIGAGISGIYQAYVLREMGFTVKGFEAGEDVGGTWYWNRYPGCRLDTESYAYGYFCIKGITNEWQWSERFAGQPELLRYVRFAAEKMDIRKHYAFATKVVHAIYNDAENLWEVESDDGGRCTCRYLVSAVGFLSATKLPHFEGMASFQGESFHSSRWPHDPDGGLGPKHVDFTGKRVGVIGTGATGVQIIAEVAKTAAALKVFQRTPNWCTPLGNVPLSQAEMDKMRANYDGLLEYVKTTDTAFPYHRSNKKGVDTTPEEREAFFESLYRMPGYALWLASYRDLLTNRTSNSYLGDFVASKIRQRVKNPAIAEKLIPKNHPFGTKRVPMETHYYEVYNQDNVELVDLNEAPIERVEPQGIRTADQTLHALDMIIYATGFDAVTGALDRIDIRGRNGQQLKDVWEDGPLTYLGLQVHGFPNFFTLVGPHNGAAFCNIGVCGGLQAEWVARMIRELRNRGLAYSEPTEAAQQQWTDQVIADFDRTLMAEANAWWVKVKTHPDGRVTRRSMVYVGGGPEYRKICDQVAFHDYRGFILK